VAAAAAPLAAACNQRAVESWLAEDDAGPRAPSLYEAGEFTRALEALRRRVPAPVQALSLLIYPDHVVLQAQDPARLDVALQYVLRDGAVAAPVAVTLLGTGKLEDNLFPLDSARLEAIPALVAEARTRANLPEGRVARVLLKRALPESMDVQYRVFLTSERRDAVIHATAEGRLL